MTRFYPRPVFSLLRDAPVVKDLLLSLLLTRPFTPACYCMTSILRRDSTPTTVPSVTLPPRTCSLCFVTNTPRQRDVARRRPNCACADAAGTAFESRSLPSAVRGMLSEWRGVDAEGAWWNTNPCRSMRSSSSCPLSLGSMVAAGNATSVPKTTAPR